MPVVNILMLTNFMVMGLLILVQSFFYFKVSVKSMIRFPIILTTGLFSLIITPLLLQNEVPTTPFIQIFFVLYQTLLFFFSTIEYLKIKKER